MTRKIILDCDPGHDDAIAILLAHGSSEIELVAITTVAGNQTLEKVTRNALSVATVIRMTGVPIAQGCDRPLVRTQEVSPTIHGESGMEGPRFRQPTTEIAPLHAVQLIIETVMSHEPGEITLVPTGPLTNIAMAARLEPRIIPRVREVVLMGGGYHVGNWSAVAEFNIKIDPEAAHIVFGAGWPVTMVGLDLTHQALATPEIAEKVRAVGTQPAQFVLEVFDFYGTAYKGNQDFDSPPVHDACAVAYVIDPQLISTRKAPIAIELTGSETLGMTVADFRGTPPTDCPTQVAVDLDFDRFWQLVVDALVRIGEVES